LAEIESGEVRRGHFEDAAGEFEWATQEQPGWPYGWYGLGLAELGVGDSPAMVVNNFQTMLGRDALSRSASAFARSAEVDPGFVAGLSELSATALRQRVNVRLDVALAALRRASRTPAASAPAVLLARGRVERAIGSLDSSSAALRRLAERDTGNVVARYELARTGFLRGDSIAGELWYDALATGDSSTTSLIREDLLVILPDSVLGAFDDSSAQGRADLVRQFWERRDDEELHSRGERLAEHYRRLDHARRSYRLVSERRHYGIAERYRSTQSEYDDRGVIYIRHGEPDDKARYAAPGIEPNESWVYRRDGGDLLFHFVAREDVQDYRLVESLFDVLDFASVLELGEGDGLGESTVAGELRQHASGLLRSRERLAPIYSRLLATGRGGSNQFLAEERSAGKRAIERGTTTDSWPLDLGDALDIDLLAAAIADEGDRPAVQLAFAIPGNALAKVEGSGGLVYPVRLRASVIDMMGTTVAVLDTTIAFRPGAAASQRRPLLGLQSLAVPPGSHTVRFSVQTGLGGAISQRDTIHVTDPLANEVQLGDVALGRRAMDLRVVAGADTVWIDPTGTFPRDQEMLLHIEAAGLRTGENYPVELEVRRPGGGSFLRRLFGGGGASIKVRFDHVAAAATELIGNELRLDRLDPGEYRVTVKLAGRDGREVARSRSIRVVE
ncbi:MAG TPA: GWxTD domain-containing protein, partial [Gemmatimonadales bacterium]|nr:GWxTD domain-containing protein [Gemmatimonadales bacterium]